MHDASGLLAVLALTTIGCGDDGAGKLPDAGVSCIAPTGAGVTHNTTISADERWRAADGPHLVSFGINVAAGATLTIEPCAEVRLQKTYSIVVQGDLVAEGTATTPISFVADNPAEPWGFLQVFAPGTLRLAYATVSGGGGEPINAYAMIEARGDQLLPVQPILKLDHVAVTNSADFGVSVRTGAGFTADSGDVTISGSALAPMRIVPRLATNVPTGTYTGNAEDAIVVETEAYGDVAVEDVVFHDRGVRYRIGGGQTLGELVVGPAHHTLTLEAGVELAFTPGGRLRVADDGATTGVLAIAGTAASPVVLTSAASVPTAGDWVGVTLGKLADPGFKIDHAELRYAGGPSFANGFHCEPNPPTVGQLSLDEDAALTIYHQPAGAVITNSVIADTAGDGVNLAYTGTSVDQLATNSFTNVASCRQTLPRPAAGGCPATVPCP